MINAQTLAMMRNGVAGLRTTPCTISRGGSSIASVNCRIRPDREYAPVPGQPLAVAERWLIYLPPGQDVQPFDMITALGDTYQAVIVDAPRTVEVSRMVTCYLLFDADGNPVYLKPNGTISTTRPSGPGVAPEPILTNVRANMRDPDVTRNEQYTAAGTIVQKIMMLVPGTDIREGDFVTIIAQDGHPSVEEVSLYAVGEEPSYQTEGVAFISCKLIGS